MHYVDYIHEREDWPAFRWDEGAITAKLVAVRHRQGHLLGRMEGLGFNLRNEATLHTLTQDVVKSSEIEGEILNTDQVRSSIARRLNIYGRLNMDRQLGMDVGALTSEGRDVEGVVEMTLDATAGYDKPLTAERLFDWHAALFPAGRSGMQRIITGGWRDDRSGPMQVVSGPVGRERVHFQAPDAARLNTEMAAFLKWLGQGQSIDSAERGIDLAERGIDLVLKSAIAHLWFVTIHPFEDGNGRIARAIADMVLARSEGSPQRFYSMSAQIRQERETYYERLATTQKGDLDITPWLDWFLDCLGRAFDGAEGILANVFHKARFWEEHGQTPFNPRQRDMLERLLAGFEGKLTSSKWAKIEKCSLDTALRDISALMERGVLQKDPGGGRSTSYSLVDIADRS